MYRFVGSHGFTIKEVRPVNIKSLNLIAYFVKDDCDYSVHFLISCSVFVLPN